MPPLLGEQDPGFAAIAGHWQAIHQAFAQGVGCLDHELAFASIVALNDRGVAMGVNMLPAHLCNPERPGLNSLVLVRDTIEHASTADEAVD